MWSDVHVYSTYIEKNILDLPTNDSDQSINNQSKPKKLFFFIKSLRTDNSGVAPLKKEGQLVASTTKTQPHMCLTIFIYIIICSKECFFSKYALQF
jgi:hypothetical protein